MCGSPTDRGPLHVWGAKCPRLACPNQKGKKRKTAKEQGWQCYFPTAKYHTGPGRQCHKAEVHANISAELADLLLYRFDYANHSSVSVFDDGMVVPEDQVWLWWNLARTASLP